MAKRSTRSENIIIRMAVWKESVPSRGYSTLSNCQGRLHSRRDLSVANSLTEGEHAEELIIVALDPDRKKRYFAPTREMDRPRTKARPSLKRKPISASLTKTPSIPPENSDAAGTPATRAELKITLPVTLSVELRTPKKKNRRTRGARFPLKTQPEQHFLVRMTWRQIAGCLRKVRRPYSTPRV